MAVRSIITDDLENCYICGRPADHIHHVIYGTGNRSVSDREGLIVGLCWECHTRVHAKPNKGMDLLLKTDAEKAYRKDHSFEEWVRKFGKSRLGE